MPHSTRNNGLTESRVQWAVYFAFGVNCNWFKTSRLCIFCELYFGWTLMEAKDEGTTKIWNALKSATLAIFGATIGVFNFHDETSEGGTLRQNRECGWLQSLIRFIRSKIPQPNWSICEGPKRQRWKESWYHMTCHFAVERKRIAYIIL